MTLYEIKEAILNGIVIDDNGSVVNPETGEVLTKEEFAKLAGDLDEGIENLLCWAKDLKADSKAIKEEEANLAERRKSYDKKADNIIKYAAFLLDGRKFKTAKCAASWRNVTKCVCNIPAEQLPEQFQRVKHSVEANLVDLKAYLAAGNEVDGVELVIEKSMSVK